MKMYRVHFLAQVVLSGRDLDAGQGRRAPATVARAQPSYNAAMSARSRISTALVAIAMLLFAQLAVASFACDMPAPATAAAMADCAGGGMDGAPLCEKHCHPEAQSQAPAAFAACPFVASFIVAVPQPAVATLSPGAPPRALQNATSPPIPISYCRLRD